MTTKKELALEISEIRKEILPIFQKTAGLYRKVEDLEKAIRKIPEDK